VILNLPPQLGQERVMKSPRGAGGSGGTTGDAAVWGVVGVTVGNLLPQDGQKTASAEEAVPHAGQYFWFAGIDIFSLDNIH